MQNVSHQQVLFPGKALKGIRVMGLMVQSAASRYIIMHRIVSTVHQVIRSQGGFSAHCWLLRRQGKASGFLVPLAPRQVGIYSDG
jgi:hypothetical protein